MSDTLKPLSVKTEHLAPKAVTTSKIGDKAITAIKIEDGAVTKEKLADLALDSAEIKDGAVTTSKLREQAVTTPKLADASVDNAKLKDNAVSTTKLQDGIVTKEKLRDGSVTKEKMADGTIGTAEIIDGAVTTAKLGAGSVTQSKIAANAIGSSEIQDNAVNSREISNGAVTPPKLAAVDSPADGEVPTYNQAQAKLEWKPMSGGITRPLTPPIATDEIADKAVTYDKIENYSVNNEKLASAAVIPSKVDAVNAPADGQVLSYESSSSRFKYVTPSAGGMQMTLLQSAPMAFTEQSAGNIDQIVDLTVYIPVTAQAVLLEIQFNAMSVPSGLEQILTVYGRRSGAEWGQSTIHFIWQNVANLNNNLYKECVVATDANRQIRVIINKGGQFTSTNVWLKGYIE